VAERSGLDVQLAPILDIDLDPVSSAWCSTPAAAKA
jgi:hypothetical protein